VIADEAIGLLQESNLERGAVPNPCGDEMMKLVIANLASTGRYGLHALPVSWTDQACDVEWAHAPTRRMGKPGQKRLKPPFQIVSPTFC
jgi:hypothetical protein